MVEAGFLWEGFGAGSTRLLGEVRGMPWDPVKGGGSMGEAQIKKLTVGNEDVRARAGVG